MMKKYPYTFLVAPIIALILEALPYGAVLNFANPNGEPYRRTFSYFDMTPFGYANIGPLITALLTCATAILVVIWCINRKEKLYGGASMLSMLAFLASLSPLLYGLESFSIVGGLISLTLLAQFCLMAFMGRNNKNENS